MREQKKTLKELGFDQEPVHYDEFDREAMDEWVQKSKKPPAEKPKLNCGPMMIAKFARNAPPQPKEAFTWAPPSIPDELRGGRPFDNKIHLENKPHCPFERDCSLCRKTRREQWLDCHQYYLVEKKRN